MAATRAGGGVRPRLILGICCISLGLIGLDTTIVAVALPSIGRDLHAQVSGLQWIVAGYTIALTSCLLSSGTLADRSGRRRVFQVGLSAFALARLPLLVGGAAAATGCSAIALSLAGGPQPPGQAPRRSGVLLPRGLRFRRARSASPDDAVPQADAPGPGPAALHHDRRPAQPSGNGTGGSQDDAGYEPQAGPDTYQVDKSTPTTLGQAVPESLPAAGSTVRTLDSQAVAEALASLSRDHRQVIVETYYRGRSVAETAAALGIPAATVKSRTFYALKALKLALQERI